MKYLTYIFIAGLMLLVVGCGTWMEDFDVEATVEARIASIPTPKPQIVIQEVVKEIVKEVEVEVEKIVEVEVHEFHEVEVPVYLTVEVEKIVVVIATATPSPTPRPTVTPRPTPTPDPYRYEGVVFTWDDSPENLPYELETDTDAANRNYLNAQLTITGEVYGVRNEGDLDSYGNAYWAGVILITTHIYKGGLKGSVSEQLYCYRDLEEENQNSVILNPAEETGTWENVKAGDNVTVRGIVFELQYGEMYLHSCSIVD